MNIVTCIDSIKKQFNVIDIIDCDNYDTSSVDLYNQIQKLYQESYEISDRLIFSITQDFYKKETTAGIMLQSLQAMLNDIDISNFFVCVVTTNPNIKNEYRWVLDNISTDKISINIYECDGEYHQIEATTQTSYIKYQKIQGSGNLIDSLTEKQKKLLFESDSFCIIPWTSMMIDTSSKVKPCCHSSEIIGDCSQNSLREIWNSVETKQLRKNMLENKKIESCKSCYFKENLGQDTLRKSINRRFANHVNKIELTRADGFLENYSLNYLDARFNNLCNLSCRSCGPWASSSWYQPAVAIGQIDKSVKALQVAGKHIHNIFDQIMEHINVLDRIYFAGGEPLMIDQFYKLVEELDRQGRHEVELIYNTNMTQSSLAGKSIFDVWKNFKKISIGASLDGEHQRGEYLRCGQKWNDVVEFRKEMLSKRPDIDFYISATASIINALHLPDFHRSWVNQGLIKPEDFNIQILLNPAYLRVDQAPEYLKNLIKEKYHEHLDWLRPKDSVSRAIYGFESILNYLDNDNKFDATEFWNRITPLDKYYKKDLIEYFPELAELPVN
jgi:radical SAM protein with 4Fe4S-binding SPASM domain